MALAQVLVNPLVGNMTDTVGKRKAMMGGISLVSGCMLDLVAVIILTSGDGDSDIGGGSYTLLAETMCVWDLGGTLLSKAPVA